jgi:acyl-coenzyme A thioesterase PaaI-like protein
MCMYLCTDGMRVAGASAMLGEFPNTGTNFDQSMKGMVVTAVEEGTVTCEIPVSHDLTNAYGTLHGG